MLFKNLIAFVLLASSSLSLACPVSADQFATKLKRVALLELNPSISTPESPIITEKEFYNVVNKVLKVYNTFFTAQGRSLKISASWKDQELNAYAAQEGKESWIHLSGGYAQAPYMSRDAYYTVICHELGHHLGGFPRKESSFASTEGQADYYSTAKCMKVILKFDPQNRRIAESLKIPPQIKALCRKEHRTQDDYYVCLRSVKAAEDYGRMSYFMKNKKNPETVVNLLLRDTNITHKTFPYHPEPQCRLDTKLEGALCNLNERLYFGEKDETQGACHKNKGHSVGMRPACWFASAFTI